MLDRLSEDPVFGVGRDALRELLDPLRFVGRAPQQVDEFLGEVLEPALATGDEGAVDEREEVRV